MGFWAAPFMANLTSTSLDHRQEFILAVIVAIAGSGAGADAETFATILASATTADPSDYGDPASTLDRAFAFLLDFRDAETSPRRYRVVERAAAGLRSAGARDQRAAFVS